MSKKFMFRFALGLVAVVVAVMWLLSVIPSTKDAMGWFTLGWAITIIAGVFGLAFIFRGLFGKSAGPLKKLNIYFGAGFVLVAVLSMIGELAMDSADKQNLVIPIIAVVVTVALLLGFVAVGGKKWDQGDNQNVGYKNYYQRKAEEEKLAEKNKDEK